MRRRLEGRTVAVTRDGDGDDPLVAALAREGARTALWPTLAFEPPENPHPLRDALSDPGGWDWIVFTSARTVDPVADQLDGLDGVGAGLAAVGAATASAVEARGGRVRVVGDGGGAQLAGALAREATLSDARILFPAASRASDQLSDALEAAGARVERVEAYRTVLHPPDGDRIRSDLEGGVDAVTFASPSAVDALDQALEGSLAASLGTRPAVAIGPTTASALEERGVLRVVVAAETSLDGLVEAVIHVLEDSGG